MVHLVRLHYFADYAEVAAAEGISSNVVGGTKLAKQAVCMLPYTTASQRRGSGEGAHFCVRCSPLPTIAGRASSSTLAKLFLLTLKLFLHITIH